MKLSTVLKQAKSSELKGLEVRKDDESIIAYINLAMLALYTRFQLRTEEAIVSLSEDKTLYELDGSSVNTLGDPDVTVKGSNIEDGDVLVVVDAFDENGRIAINDETDPLSIFTTSFDAIQVPTVSNESYISVIYQAAPPEVEYVATAVDDCSAMEATVKLPRQLLEPLLYYVGYRAHATNESLKYLEKFEASCTRIERLGLLPADSYNRMNEVKGFEV